MPALVGYNTVAASVLPMRKRSIVSLAFSDTMTSRHPYRTMHVLVRTRLYWALALWMRATVLLGSRCNRAVKCWVEAAHML